MNVASSVKLKASPIAMLRGWTVVMLISFPDTTHMNTVGRAGDLILKKINLTKNSFR